MSIGRITMMEFTSEEAVDEAEILYEKIRAEAFPTLELVMNIRTGPTSLMSVAVYPSKESADSNLTAREKFQEKLDSSLKDSFTITAIFDDDIEKIISLINSEE